MKRKALKTTALVAAMTLGAALLATGPTSAHGPSVQGSRGGYGMMGHMGSGMMGYGAGGQGGCPFHQAAFTEELTVESVTKFLEQRLSHMGNERLKVGEVTTKDDETIVAEIVTVDGSLVQKLEFDRDTGRQHPVR